MSRAHSIWLAALISVSACSGDTPATLGGRAALAEKSYFVFGDKADVHAKTFMKAWHSACALAKGDMMSATHKDFIQAYVAGLQSEPGAAATKPLQKYVREKWWKSGTGCATIAVETPTWALE